MDYVLLAVVVLRGRARRRPGRPRARQHPAAGGAAAGLLARRAGTGANIGISAVAAATASIAHIRAGRVNWRLFAWMAPPSIAGALVGGYLSGVLPGDVLLLAIAAVLLYSAFELLAQARDVSRKRRGPRGPRHPGRRAHGLRDRRCWAGSSA